jgi:hypothetical protein
MKKHKLSAVELLLDARGQYIPRDFVTECDPVQWGLKLGSRWIVLDENGKQTQAHIHNKGG